MFGHPYQLQRATSKSKKYALVIDLTVEDSKPFNATWLAEKTSPKWYRKRIREMYSLRAEDIFKLIGVLAGHCLRGPQAEKLQTNYELLIEDAVVCTRMKEAFPKRTARFRSYGLIVLVS